MAVFFFLLGTSAPLVFFLKLEEWAVSELSGLVFPTESPSDQDKTGKSVFPFYCFSVPAPLLRLREHFRFAPRSEVRILDVEYFGVYFPGSLLCSPVRRPDPCCLSSVFLESHLVEEPWNAVLLFPVILQINFFPLKRGGTPTSQSFLSIVERWFERCFSRDKLR